MASPCLGGSPGQMGMHRPHLFPPYTTMTHPVVERIPLVGSQLGQGQSGGLRFPQWTPGPAQYPCAGQSGYAGHENGQRHATHAGCGTHLGRLDLLGVHDEEGDGVWRLVVSVLIGPVVALVGVQTGDDSPGVTGQRGGGPEGTGSLLPVLQ